MRKLNRIWVVALTLSVGLLFAAEEANVGRVNRHTYTGADALRGVVVSGSREQAELEITNVHGIKIVEGKDFDLLRGKAFEKALIGFAGRPALQEQTRADLVEAIWRFYREHGRPLVEVNAPELESLSYGVVQVFVLEGKLGQEVEVKGNKWFKKSLFTDQLNLKQGEVIQQDVLLRDVGWLNRSQFREVGVTYRPGREVGQTDVTISVRDRFPLSGTIGYDNSGVEGVGEHRITAGFDWGNAFGIDHRLSYRFNTDVELERLRAHFATYEIPLPWRDSIRIFGGYAEVNVPVGADGTVEGQAYSASGRYDLTLPALGRLQHQISGGFDYKNSDTEFSFGGAQVLSNQVEIAQFALTYSMGLVDVLGTNLFRADGFYAPGDLFSQDNDTIFNRVRPGAEANYAYSRFFLERSIKLFPFDRSHALIALRGTGQIASGRLVQSEQLVFGGMNSLRGFREFLVLGDQGYIVNVEVMTPALRLIKHLSSERLREFDDGLRLIGFFDYGWANTIDPVTSDRIRNVTMSSAGFGVRYYASRYFNVRFDYGFQLESPEVLSGQLIDPDDHRAHIAASISF